MDNKTKEDKDMKPHYDVIVYSKSGDPYSDMLKNLLQYNNIPFENIEVSNKPKLLKKISGQTAVTPVLDVKGKIFVGFDREKMREVLGIKS